MICQICKELIIHNDYEAECGHVFHTLCLEYSECETCPTCKDSLIRDRNRIKKDKRFMNAIAFILMLVLMICFTSYLFGDNALLHLDKLALVLTWSVFVVNVD